MLGNDGSGTVSTVICGINWVTDRAGKIEVANMSLGAPGTDDETCGMTVTDTLHRAVCRSVAAGVFYAVAAGNESVNVATEIPAAYDEVLTTTAMADFDGRPGSE